MGTCNFKAERETDNVSGKSARLTAALGKNQF